MTMGPTVIGAPPKVQIEVSVAPVYNALASLGFVGTHDVYPGVHSWIAATTAALSRQRLHTHRTLFQGVPMLLAGLSEHPAEFPALVDAIAAANPTTLRDRAVAVLAAEVPEARDLLADVQAYASAIETTAGPRQPIDREVIAAGHALLNDPAALLDAAVEHYRYMWHEHLAREWDRVRPHLLRSVQALAQRDLQGLPALAAVRVVTGRRLEDVFPQLVAGVGRLVFVPSRHVGPYLAGFRFDDTLHLVFGAYELADSDEFAGLSRTEMLVRLAALADDVRLRILEMATDRATTAQEVMDQLDLSQSSASRQLRQLVAAGFLRERRTDAGKRYRLDRERVTETTAALQARFGGDTVTTYE